MLDTQNVSLRAATSRAIDLSSVRPEDANRADLMFELLDAFPIAAFWKDDQARFVGGNRVMLDTLGLSGLPELVGRCDHDFHLKAEADGYLADDLSVIESGEAILDQHEFHTRSDGTVEVLSMTKLPIRNPAGAIVGLMGFFTEIGEQPQVWASAYEDELIRHEEIAGSVHSMDYTLFYQPIFDVRSGELASVEALLRWSPTAGEVRTPDGFLPHLEATGLIRPVGLWVVEEASRQLREWRDRYESAADLTVAVNISRVQFESPTLVEDVTERVLANRLDPDSVTLEITETAASSAEADIVSGLLSFRDQGFSIALDDFGVGQSSLSVLCDLPIEIVKVDRSFITSPDTSTSAPRTARISARDHVLRSVVGLVRNLGLKTTVEGVETKEQYERLRAMACDMVQGFWPARPMPATEIAKLF